MVQFIKNFDKNFLRFINEKLKCRFLDFVMTYVTFLGSLSFCMIFTIFCFISRNKSLKELGILVAMSIVTSGGITQVLKRLSSRIRPYIAIPTLKVKKIGVDDYSFPSGHTTAAFSIGLSIALLFPSLAIISIGLACLVGFSRMYLGVHYPTDVFAGVVVGIFSTLIIYFIL